MLVAPLLAGLAGCGGGAAPDGGNGDGPAGLPIGVIRGTFVSHGPQPFYRTADQFWYALGLRDTGTDEIARTILIEDDLWRVDLVFEFAELPVSTYQPELLRYRVGAGGEIETLWAGQPVTVTLDSPLVEDVMCDYYLIGEGDGIISYQYRLYGSPSADQGPGLKWIRTCFRVVGDEDERLFRQSQTWPFSFLPEQPWDGLIFDDLNNDYETDAINKLPDLEIIIGVYGFSEAYATGNEYEVYGELETPVRPTFGNDHPEPVMIDVDFDNPVLRTLE